MVRKISFWQFRGNPLLPAIRHIGNPFAQKHRMIRKLQSGEYRLYSRKKDAKSGKRKKLGTKNKGAVAKKHGGANLSYKRVYFSAWSFLLLAAQVFVFILGGAFVGGGVPRGGAAVVFSCPDANSGTTRLNSNDVS